jgi:hypothetical protein
MPVGEDGFYLPHVGGVDRAFVLLVAQHVHPVAHEQPERITLREAVQEAWLTQFIRFVHGSDNFTYQKQ